MPCARTAIAPLFLLPLLACATRLPTREPPPAAALGPPPPLSYYEVDGPVPEARKIEIEHVTPWVEVRRIHLPARVPDDLREHSHALDDIEIVHFRPRPVGGTPRALVLMSPILGNDMTLMPEFAYGFTRLGYHAAVVIRKDFDFDPESAMVDAENEFRILIMRMKQALDWLERLPEVDGRRVATFGVSAGAILSACLAGADTRPRAHVFVLAGGPLADVLTQTEEDRFRDYAKELVGETGWTQAQVRQQLLDALRTDPVRLASRVPRESVLLFVARRDTSVPTPTGFALWEALGRPALRTLPFGHYLSFLLLPWIQHETNVFLRHRLGPP